MNKSKSAIGNETDFANSGFNKSAQDFGTSLPFNTVLLTINIAGTTPIIE